MMQQVVKGKNAEFFFQQVAPLRANAFQIFNRMAQYVGCGGDDVCFGTKLKEWLIAIVCLLEADTPVEKILSSIYNK